jgi:hypothetical protein
VWQTPQSFFRLERAQDKIYIEESLDQVRQEIYTRGQQTHAPAREHNRLVILGLGL